MYKLTHIKGKDIGKIVLYALSTCAWCRKTKKFFDSIKAAYDYVNVDLLDKKNNDEAESDIKKWNPRCTFPTVVINDKECIIGYDEKKMKALLK